MSAFRVLPLRFYRRPAEEVARDLLGRYLVRELDGDTRGRRLVVKLVETEAYLGAVDRASHAWNGRRTARNESLYLSPGHAYVYFIYGMHFCLNAVAGAPESGRASAGGAVLLRAAEVVEGAEILAENRGLVKPARPGDLAGGPGKLCQALGIDRSVDGHRLDAAPLRLTHGEPPSSDEVAAGPRVGIDYAGEAVGWPLRYGIRGHREMSRPRL